MHRMVEILNEILGLLVTIDRELEPWVCDTLLDAVKLAVSSADLDSRLLYSFINSPEHNVQLKLRLMKILVEENVNSEELNVVVSRIFNHIKEFPLDVLNICAAAKDSPQFSEVIQNNTELILNAVSSCSQSRSISVRKGVIKVIPELCHFISSSPLLLFDTINDQELTFEVLSYMFQNDQQDVAVSLFKQYRISSSFLEKEVMPLCAIRAYEAFQQLSEGATISELKINFNGSNNYWKSFFRNLVSHLRIKNSVLVLKLYQILSAHQNFAIISALLEDMKDRQEQEIKEILRGLFVSHSLLQEALDFMYDDCSNLHQQRSAHSLILSCMEMGIFIAIVNESNVCHHHVKCDLVDLACFTSSFFTFISQCSPDTLSIASPTLCKLVTLDEYQSLSLHPELLKILFSKLMFGESRVQDMVLQMLNSFREDRLDSRIIRTIIDLTLDSEDCYIKSSCLSVLTGLSYESLESDDMSHEKLLDSLIKSVEFDDSMVAISLLKFLKVHHGHIITLISENIESLRKVRVDEDPLESTGHQNIAQLDVDDVINDVCKNSDCLDVSLVRKYKDRALAEDTMPIGECIVLGLFKLIVSHRCDVERLKASIDLVSLIIKRLDSEDERAQLLDYLDSTLFSVIDDCNSPFLRVSIRDLNSVLKGHRTFSELLSSPYQDIKTVLSILQSTPDPSIVMDCY